jgi:hypothetical protein
MRFSYSMPRVVLLIFGVSYFALWAWHPTQSDGDGVFRVLGPAMNYLFPALLNFLSAIFFLTERLAIGDPAHETAPRSHDTTPFFVFAAVLYLPLILIVASEEGLKEVKLRPTLSALLGICFILLWLSFAYEQVSLPAESRGRGSGKAQRFEKIRLAISRWFLRVASWLHPGLLLSTGAVLVLASLFSPIGDGPTGFAFLRGKGSWVTSISEVTGGIGAIQVTKDFLGRTVYMIALGLAAAAVIVMLRREFRSPSSRPSRLWTGLTGLSSFLAIYSAADLNFGWLGLAAYNRKADWMLFCMWLVMWLMPLVLWIRLLLKVYKGGVAQERPRFSWMILLYLPVVLYNVEMAPALVGDFLNLTGIASYVAGLQFLCWGFVRSITVSLNKRPMA